MLYRQRLIDGKLRFVLAEDNETIVLDGGTPPAGHPFDEKDEKMPMPTKKAERKVEHFHDMQKGTYKTSYNNAGTTSRRSEKFRIGHDDYCVNDAYEYGNDDWSIYGSNEKMGDSISTITRSECDIWNSWMIPSWLRRRKTAYPRNGKMNNVDYYDKEAESYTTATASSWSYSSFGSSSGTDDMSITGPQLVVEILYDEIVGACGSKESIYDKSKPRLRTYKIVKERQGEKVGLSFATNNHNGKVYICDIKEGSKFLHTGLRVGSRVVSINGISVPKNPKILLKLIKRARKELVLVAETPKETFIYGLDQDDSSFNYGFCKR